ncbi:hypothetical protein GGE07_005321 [Sinorhizobium terangae]|nr:hypothetical protein [Sinorhizobium terangae]
MSELVHALVTTTLVCKTHHQGAIGTSGFSGVADDEQ